MRKGGSLNTLPSLSHFDFSFLEQKKFSFLHTWEESNSLEIFVFQILCIFKKKFNITIASLLQYVWRREREIQRVTRQRKACLVVYQHHQHDLNFFYSQQRSKHLVIWFLKPMESAGTWDATQGTTSDVIQKCLNAVGTPHIQCRLF